MGLVDRKLADLRRAGRDVQWKITTMARVGYHLGIPQAVRWPGAKVLARELSRLRLNTSTNFRFHAANDPDRSALIQVGVPGHKAPGAPEVARLSYGQLDDLSDRIAAALRRRGVARGSAAMVMLKNRVEYFYLGLAAGRAGAAVVTVSWRSTVPELEYLARHSGAEAVFFDADCADVIREAAPLLRGIPRRNFISVGGPVSGFPSLEDIAAGPVHGGDDHSSDASLVMYTSGTTGKPKGAVRKMAGGVLPSAFAFFEQTPLALGEVHLTVCPVYHATATAFSNFTFLLGGTVAVLADFRPDAFLDAVERYRVTSTALVPTMIHRVVELGPEAIRARDTSSLRAIFSGGAPLPGVLAIEAMDVLGDKIYNFYGATETGIVTVASPADLRAAPGTIGRLVPGTEVRLVDDQGRDVPVGTVGELYARSAMLVEGYHADAGATKSSMLDGYFSVGDLARKDGEGRFHIEGRKRDMIISGGVNVYPAEVEAALEAHPAVAEVAVVGVPDREWGELVRAFVVLRSGQEASADDLKAHCKARLAGPKTPRDFVFLDVLPRNPTGKVLKRELRTLTPA
jgi:acyl-CoA synthetase (AMP-forming)/AMP-acid ligase II